MNRYDAWNEVTGYAERAKAASIVDIFDARRHAATSGLADRAKRIYDRASSHQPERAAPFVAAGQLPDAT